MKVVCIDAYTFTGLTYGKPGRNTLYEPYKIFEEMVKQY